MTHSSVATSLTPAARRSAAWLGVALACTSATQLRLGGAPVGPGEVMLAAWLAVEIVVLGLRGRVTRSPIVRWYAAFWAVTSMALALGAMSSITLGYWDEEFARNLPAIALAAITSIVFLLGGDHVARMRVVMRAATITLTCCMLALAGAVLTGRLAVGPVQPLYESFRFAGWSENPNQLALALLPLPYVCVEWIGSSRSMLMRVAIAGVTGAVLGIGVATQSDALMLSWTAGTALLLLRTWLRTVGERGRSVALRVFAVLVLPIGVAVGLVAGRTQIETVLEERAAKTYSEGGQGQDRITLWKHGVDAATRSPLVGLGPGGYSGIEGPFGRTEAHNSFVDWLDASGLIGLSALIALLGAASVIAGTDTRTLGIATVASLCVFLMFHFVLRQPVFWMYLLSSMLSPRLESRAPAPFAPLLLARTRS